MGTATARTTSSQGAKDKPQHLRQKVPPTPPPPSAGQGRVSTTCCVCSQAFYTGKMKRAAKTNGRSFQKSSLKLLAGSKPRAHTSEDSSLLLMAVQSSPTTTSHLIRSCLRYTPLAKSGKRTPSALGSTGWPNAGAALHPSPWPTFSGHCHPRGRDTAR